LRREQARGKDQEKEELAAHGCASCLSMSLAWLRAHCVRPGMR
jgi:hypothetical protein